VLVAEVGRRFLVTRVFGSGIIDLIPYGFRKKNSVRFQEKFESGSNKCTQSDSRKNLNPDLISVLSPIPGKI